MSIYKTPEWDPEVRRIVRIDGEGKTLNGRHAYTLLAAADDRGFRGHIQHDGTYRAPDRFEGLERYVNPVSKRVTQYSAIDTAPNAGLSTVDCLEFLLSIPRHKSDLLIAFAFTYDQTKILQDLPYAAMAELAELGVTVWGEYVISGIPRKYFDIRKGERHVRIWDTFSYWQMSFAKALNSSLNLFGDELREVIKNIEMMKR